jgi:hypothetical protein
MRQRKSRRSRSSERASVGKENQMDLIAALFEVEDEKNGPE